MAWSRSRCSGRYATTAPAYTDNVDRPRIPTVCDDPDFKCASEPFFSHWPDAARPVCPLSNNVIGKLDQAISPDSLYKMIRDYAAKAGIKNLLRAAHSLRATAATNSLERGAR